MQFRTLFVVLVLFRTNNIWIGMSPHRIHIIYTTMASSILQLSQKDSYDIKKNAQEDWYAIEQAKRNQKYVFLKIYTHIHICVYCLCVCVCLRDLVSIFKQIYIASLSSCLTDNSDLPDNLSPPISILYRSQDVFQAKSCISTDLLYIGSSWSSNLCSSMWRGLLEYIPY